MNPVARLGRLIGLLAGVVVVLATAAPAVAHDATSTAYAEVSGAGQDVRVVLDLEYDLLMKSAWLYAEAYEATDPAEQRRQLAAHADAVAAYALERFQVAYDGSRCAGELAGVPGLTERADRAFAVVTLNYRCPDGEGTHELFSALFPDDENFVHSTKTIVHYDLGGAEGAAVLAAGEPTHAVADGDAGSTVRTEEGSTWRNLGDFVVLGGEHLMLGPDHVLFLLALLIGARGHRDVVVTATTFTVAHSVTFLLAAVGLVEAPSGIVEPLIALSIVAVATIHVVRPRADSDTTRWRLPVVFAFGLLHGLGFAGALGIDERWSWQLLSSLLAFNVGLELAQLGLVVLVFPILTLLRRSAAGNQVVLATAVLVAAVGLLWFVERLPSGADLAVLAL